MSHIVTPKGLTRADDMWTEDSEPSSGLFDLDILVVDDRPANLIAIRAALEGVGARVVAADSGEAALRLLLRRDFAVILLDVQMPNMGGFETARLMRARPRSRHVPIIFVTAFDRDQSEVLEGYSLGAIDFLFKPLAPEILRAKVNVFLELERRNREIVRQAELLHEHERRQHEQELEQERAHWQAVSLQRDMDQKSRLAEELTRRADELARSIAERERTEQTLVRINRELADADRKKDEFIAVLAHELRNPLAPMTYALELITLPDGADEDTVRACEVMDRQLRHLTRLIDDLLDVSRVTSGKIELQRAKVELGALVTAAVESALPEVDRQRLSLELELCEEPLLIVADSVRITQVIINLLGNAARYTEANGSVRVKCWREGDECFVRVDDTGRGIRPELLDGIFEPFVQERAGGGGLGIGLALVRSLVALHGGTVTADSEGPGKGSSFLVRLPAAPAVGETVAEPESVAPLPRETAPPSSHLRIAIIEDQPDISETLAALLQRWGHTVESANDGAVGLELVLQSRPNVALVDIGLPGVSGYELARAVKTSLGKEAPLLVAITGYGQEKDRQRSREAGFDHHLVKPVRPDDLRRVLFAR